MIRRLKIKVVALGMAALLFLLAVIVTAMNIVNYDTLVEKSDITLGVLAKNDGTYPEQSQQENNKKRPYSTTKKSHDEVNYFSALLDESNTIIATETSRTHTIDDELAKEYTLEALDKGTAKGFVGDFRYLKKTKGKELRIIFLDCERRIEAFFDFLYASISVSVIALLVAFVFIFIFAGKIIRPIAESYEKQKRFITDAGHEIKTPLTIINANVDLLESELGENESLCDIAKQTNRLCALTNDLVTLARMEEAEETLQKIEFPISEVVLQAVTPFEKVAASQGKQLVYNIQPMLSLKGNDNAIVKLVDILMDNALKYSPQGSTVTFDLTKQGRAIIIHTSNTTKTKIDNHQASQVFERFYRMDVSRNSESGGLGIGLSIAQAIVNAHGGKIYTLINDEYSFQITASFPI